jgi:hypothetical protein
MRTIHKYEINISDSTKIILPRLHAVVKVALQQAKIQAWAVVDTDCEDKVERTFQVVGTGQAMPTTPLHYLDSVFLSGFVWHVFTSPNVAPVEE